MPLAWARRNRTATPSRVSPFCSDFVVPSAFSALIAIGPSDPLSLDTLQHTIERVPTCFGEGDRSRLVDEIAERAAAISAGRFRATRSGDARLDTCELRARSLAEAGGASAETLRAAAVEFLGDAVTTLALDGAWERGEARRAV